MVSNGTNRRLSYRVGRSLPIATYQRLKEAKLKGPINERRAVHCAWLRGGLSVFLKSFKNT
jgi:hypothetical protein